MHLLVETFINTKKFFNFKMKQLLKYVSKILIAILKINMLKTKFIQFKLLRRSAINKK